MASIKFVNLGDSYVLPVKHTQEYNELSNMISRNLRELTPLKDVSGFETVAIHNFKTYVSTKFKKVQAKKLVKSDKYFFNVKLHF